VARTPVRSPDGKPKILPPIRPNVGITVAYQKRLDALIAEMQNSLVYWLTAQYRKTPPVMAMDRNPANELNDAFEKLARRWLRRFNQLAPSMASYFGTAVQKRSDASLKAALKRAGVTVQFKMTKAQKDALDATINENVGLIKSIAQQHLAEVQGLVMRSVSAGRDMGSLSKELQARYGVTKRRAALIARTQNEMATATMNRARQVELGITEAVWMHSSAGREPRPSHVAMNGKRYEVAKGMFDPEVDKMILPGQLINCRCSSRSIIPGLD
jgi:SPP1 gp7 family putative phage head morphogenesis protein